MDGRWCPFSKPHSLGTGLLRKQRGHPPKVSTLRTACIRQWEGMDTNIQLTPTMCGSNSRYQNRCGSRQKAHGPVEAKTHKGSHMDR